MSREHISGILGALRDVVGVHGSFALRLNGELAGKDLPAVFADELFVEVGARLSRFVETMAAEGDEVSSAIFRFDEHRLHVTRCAHGLLVVITDGQVNMAALRMAQTLTVRRLEPELAALSTSAPPVVTPQLPIASGGPSSVMPGSQGVPRTYRGRLLPG